MTDDTAVAPARSTRPQALPPCRRLADRLSAVTPPAPCWNSPGLTVRFRDFRPPSRRRLNTSAAIAARAERRAAARARSSAWRSIVSSPPARSFPMRWWRSALRLVMARVFFLDGQTRIDGPRVPLNVQDFDLLGGAAAAREGGNLHGLPHPISPPLPVPPMLAAYLVSYAEFILPICWCWGSAPASPRWAADHDGG